MKEATKREFPIYLKTNTCVIRVDSFDAATEVDHSDKCNGIFIYNTPSVIAKLMYEYGRVTDEEWQSALLKAKAAADKFFSENIIPTREQVESI